MGARRKQPVLPALCAILFLTFLDNTIVSVGLGSLQTTLHIATFVSAGLMLSAAVLAAFTMRTPR